MFTEKNKGFTIITNFGCDESCDYCITKHHPILKNKSTDLNELDWDYLDVCIMNTNSHKVNLSGGGDPFHNYKNRFDFYNNVYKLCLKNNKLMDIHTRIIPYHNFELIKMFNKIAISIEYDDVDAIKIFRNRYNDIKDLTNIRIIQVVNKDMTTLDCLNYVDTFKTIGVKQITFRQMFGNKKAHDNFNKLRNKIKKIDGVMFLPDGEYHNYYFTTNNTLYPYFFGYTEDDRNKFKKIYEAIEQNCF